ncbi:MAG: XRE family transcriptional regulator [Coriobacteriales bacterium]|nr:XRE family transcriptional regulator [Coriobacteriales bacterium]
MPQSNIGEKITALRKAHDLTQEQLAQKCGCPVSEIIELEKSDRVATLAPLIMITRAIGVRLGTLLDDDDDLGPCFTMASEICTAENKRTLGTISDAGKLNFFSLAASKSARHIDPFIITMDPTENNEHELRSHEGEEFLYALEGPVEVQYGKEIYVLQPGDSIYYDSIVPHEVRCHEGQKAKFLACLYTL